MENLLKVSMALVIRQKLAATDVLQATLSSTTKNRTQTVNPKSNTKLDSSSKQQSINPKAEMVPNPVDNLTPGGINAY